MHVSTYTQPGVQKQPSHTLRVAVLLILEDLAGFNFLHHLERKKTNQAKVKVKRSVYF